jgi:hypothetical protein
MKTSVKLLIAFGALSLAIVALAVATIAWL